MQGRTELDVTLTCDAGIVTIEVCDNGRGTVPIAADRARATTTREVPGCRLLILTQRNL